MKCKKCKGLAVKNSKQPNGKQRYYCNTCKTSFQRNYVYDAYQVNINERIYLYLREGVGIRGTSGLLGISKTTIIRRIKQMASRTVKPILNERNQYYELDEMRVVVGHKRNEAWITYAINRHTKQVVNFIVGRRTKHNISIITKSILKLNPKMLFTDRLPSYKKLIPGQLHNICKSNTTIIERHNLTLRTHLKRLTRKTICYSKTFEMLDAVLKLYFWKRYINNCDV